MSVNLVAPNPIAEAEQELLFNKSVLSLFKKPILTAPLGVLNLQPSLR